MTEFIEHNCDLCNIPDAIEVPYAREYTNNQPLYICKSCGFVYVKHRRSEKEIADSWSNEIYQNHYTAKIPAVKARQTYVVEFMTKYMQLHHKKICDIGAGEGQFLEILAQESKCSVLAVEPSLENCKLIENMSMEAFHGTIEDFCVSSKAKNYQADVVTIIWTLENCRSCQDMIQGAYQILAEGGHIVIATGSRILVPFKKALHDYLGDNCADTHCFRFSANTLQGLLALNNFKTIHINRFIDSDYLCVVAQKQKKEVKIPWEKDDYLKVADFFERWHKESLYYR